MLTVGAAAATVTVADCLADPPGPVHVSSNSVLVESVPVDRVPLVDTAPLQPPLAVHAVASVAAHVKVDSPRGPTVLGEAVRVTVGCAGCMTMTCADCDTEPPTPLHVSV
jgi:hypothetical protein